MNGQRRKLNMALYVPSYRPRKSLKDAVKNCEAVKRLANISAARMAGRDEPSQSMETTATFFAIGSLFAIGATIAPA